MMSVFDVQWCTNMHFLFSIYFVITYFIAFSDEVSLNHDLLPGSGSYTNLTYKQISALLQHKGYKVVEFTDSPPLALDGDVAYEADQILSELAWPKGRADTHVSPNLWIDKKTGKAELFYFYDTETAPDKPLFQQAVKNWSDRTCLKITKMQDRTCKSKASHGAVCVGNFGGGACWSSTGNTFGIRNNHNFQRSSVDRCGVYASTHEFGHSIGFNHYIKRPDRDQFLTINFRNFLVDLIGSADKSGDVAWKRQWRQGKKCQKGHSYQTSIPMPYDYMSIMHLAECDGGDSDYKLTRVAKEPRHQYMLDYNRNSGITTTHYDRYLTNLMYKCEVKWAKTCKASGTSPPKCKNFGYLQQNCKCACPAGIKGSACEKKVLGTLFPPLERAKTVVEFPGPGLFTLKEHSHMKASLSPAFPNKDFQYYQYATILLKAKDAKTMVRVRVFEPGEVSQHKGLKSSTTIDTLIKYMHMRDCRLGMRLYWGDFPSGLVRTECFSTFVNNEPEVNAVILCAKIHTMSIVIIGSQGHLLQSADFSKYMLEMLQFQVSFPRNARTGMKELPTNDGSDPAKTPTPTPTNGTGVIGKDAAGASIMASKAGGIAWVGLLLLGLLCLVIPFMVKRRKKKEAEEEEESGMSLDSKTEGDSDTSSSDDADSD